MNTLVQAQTNGFHSNYHSNGLCPVNKTLSNMEFSEHFSVPISTHLFPDENLNVSEEGSLAERDYSDATIKFVSEMLMEEDDSARKPCVVRACLALEATEKSMYDVLNNDLDDDALSLYFTRLCSCNSGVSTTNDTSTETCCCQGSESSSNVGGSIEFNSNQEGSFDDESESLEMYDKVLLCPNSDVLMSASSEAYEADSKEQLRQMQSRKPNRGRPRKGKKQGVITELVDLRSLLMQCAQAIASYDSKSAHDIVMQIRQNSSPHGDGTERLAHYFANALEARLAGIGPEFYASNFSSRISASESLNAYKMFITACPFVKMSICLANGTIQILATGVTTLHIIDFGISYGFQWPCLIQALSETPGGPPRLRITGIDFPQPGFLPAERVVDTGNRLRKYCERFGVPFEYNSIAQKWETIKIEDLKIEKNELIVVNSLYQLQNVQDETLMANSPRDEVLNLIKSINPKIYIQGTINGTYNTPFFITRFREAYYYFSSMFDMFDATVPRENEQRVVYEKEILGKDAMNVIACEGTERVDRPETHRQWQVRNMRAGFRQLPLDRELVKHVRSKVKMDYHKDFSVDEDGNWMLQGWKGRVTHTLSYWQPANY